MKPKVDLVMFDFDGTLVDSKEDIAASANHLLAVMGRPPKDVDLIASYIGDGIRVLLQRTLEIDDDEAVKEAIRIFREHYWDHCLDSTKDYPGVRETLAHFKEKTKTIVTNKPKRFTDRILQGLGLSDYFAMVVGGDGLYAKKPSPEAFLAVLDALRVSPDRALAVGDSPNDINGGRAAGCLTCAVTYGLGKREALKAASPDMIVDSMAELITLID